jgi:uncharacterized protein DUF1553
VSRLYPSAFQSTFDLPPAVISAEKRYVTNVPQQRLFFLNNSVVHSQAQAIADRLKSAGDPEVQVAKAFELIYQRAPTPAELELSVAFLNQLPPVAPKTPPASVESDADAAAQKKLLPDSPLRSFIWALLSSNEFLYID